MSLSTEVLIQNSLYAVAHKFQFETKKLNLNKNKLKLRRSLGREDLQPDRYYHTSEKQPK